MTANEVRNRLKPVLEKYPREYHKELRKLIFDIRNVFRNPPVVQLTNEAQQRIAAIEADAQQRIKQLELEISNLRYTAETRKSKIAVLESEAVGKADQGVCRGFVIAVSTMLINLCERENASRGNISKEASRIVSGMMELISEIYGETALQRILQDCFIKLLEINPDVNWHVIMQECLVAVDEEGKGLYLPKLNSFEESRKH